MDYKPVVDAGTDLSVLTDRRMAGLFRKPGDGSGESVRLDAGPRIGRHLRASNVRSCLGMVAPTP